jgi:LDH2 family malate/lactate/ureidoglycolate dehydrogenase
MKALALVWSWSSAPSVPGEPVRMPGDRGRISHAQRLREGIPLPAALVQELAACDRPSGLSLPW